MDTKVLGRVWASTPETPNIDPGVSKYQLGWVAEIPVYQMLNFMDNRHDTNTLSLAERGVFQWGSDINYKQNAIAWDETDGYIYVSKVASPSTSTRPGLNTSQWEKSAIQITRKQYDDEVAAWNAHIANVANPHQLTCAILNTYTRPEIDVSIIRCRFSYFYINFMSDNIINEFDYMIYSTVCSILDYFCINNISIAGII